VCTCAALRRLSRLVSAIYDRHLEPAGLTTNQYSLLMTLAREPVPLGRLARRAATDRTTLPRNLKPLAEAGWVAISPGADARQRVAALTAAGEEALRRARPAWAKAQALIETTLGQDAVGELHGAIAGAMARLRGLRPDN
jgi:DNA-binding MarR family transcriptional regulator